MLEKKIFITRPMTPKLPKFFSQVEDICKKKWLTNFGSYHEQLEHELTNLLDVNYLNLTNNGTSALLIALKALNLPLGSEVITSPFTFAATCHSIVWNGLVPVFCDIEEENFTIDPKKIEALITPKTKAILGVHVYGFACKIEEIAQIAQKYDLKVIYDAAHAFNTFYNGKGIGNYGDATVFSFHSTKLFNTVEGGAVSSSNPLFYEIVHKLSNFGISDEEHVDFIGLNAKMNEIQAAWGLSNLEIYSSEFKRREKIYDFYFSSLFGKKGITIPRFKDKNTKSYQYFPILLDKVLEPNSRNKLYENFVKHNIYARKYFYPACSDYPCYSNIRGRNNLHVTNDVKSRILCLPFYGDLSDDQLDEIVKIIINFINK